MATCSSCYKPTCPGAESCATLHAISDLVVSYAQQSEQMPTPPVNCQTSAPTPSTKQIPTKQTAVASDSDEENWGNKLAIEATECVFRDVQLSAPPFPFRQRWDADARQVIGERKNRGRKRKRREYEEYEEEEEDYEYYDNEEFQRIYDDLMAAALATVAAANTSAQAAQPAKRRKKAMRKRKQGAAAGEGVAGGAPAGNSA